MMISLFTGVTGLKNHQTKMDVIGNNIANVNTIGFKKSTVNFQDLMSQTLSSSKASTQSGMGGKNPVQIGLGTSISSIDTVFTNGTPQATGRDSDLALSGDGMFMVTDGDETYYTRAGNFGLDGNGYIVTPNGMKVEGWPATKKSDGTTEIAASAAISPLNVKLGDILPPKGTTRAAFTGNLNSQAGLSDVRMSVDADGSGALTSKVDIDIKFSYDVTNDRWNWTATSGTSGSSVQGEGYLSVDTNGKITGITVNKPITNGTTTIIDTPTISSDVTFREKSNPSNTSTAKYVTNTLVASNQVFDSLGKQHTMATTYTKVDENIWKFDTTNTGGLTVTDGKGFITFDAYGQYGTTQIFADKAATARTSTAEAVGTGNGTNITFNLDYSPTSTTGMTITSGATSYTGSNIITTGTPTASQVYVNLNTGSVIFGTAPAAAAAVTATYNWTDPRLLATSTKFDGTMQNTFPSAQTLGLDGSNGGATWASAGIGAADPAQDIRNFYIKGGLKNSSGQYVDSNGAVTSTPYYGNTTSPYEIDDKGVIRFSGSNTSVVRNGTTYTTQTISSVTNSTLVSGQIMNVSYSGKYSFDPAGAGGALPPQNGASSVIIAPEFNNLRQSSSSYTAKFSEQDGYGMGELESYSIDESGDIMGQYSNGYKQILGRISVAKFFNPSGLEKMGGNTFRKTTNSGEPQVGQAGTGGIGKIASGSLEMSNVDLAQEFTDMIIAQRGFQANSKTISTVDQLLQDVINLKR